MHKVNKWKNTEKSITEKLKKNIRIRYCYKNRLKSVYNSTNIQNSVEYLFKIKYGF